MNPYGLSVLHRKSAPDQRRETHKRKFMMSGGCSDTNGVTNTELRTEEYGGASFLMNSKFCGEEPDDIDEATIVTPIKLGEPHSHKLLNSQHQLPKALKSDLLLANLEE